MKRYLIGAFSKRCGLSTDTLRYYEKKNLLRIEHEAGNDYRYYTDRDLPVIMSICAMRSIDVPVSQLSYTCWPYTVENFRQNYAQRMAALDSEIARLTAHRERMEVLNRELAECRTLGQPVDSTCKLFHRIEYPDGDLTAQQTATIRTWMEHMPFINLSFRIYDPMRYYAADGDECFEAKAAICCLDQYVKRFDLPTGGAEYLGGDTIVRCILKLSDPFIPRMREFKPIFNYIESRGLIINGYLQYRLRYVDHTMDGTQGYFVGAYIAVQSPESDA